MTDLRPCPFCGTTYIDTGILTVGCCRCGANGPEGYEGRDETWNTRPIEDALRAEVERIDKAERAACDLVVELRAEITALKAELDERNAMFAELRTDFNGCVDANSEFEAENNRLQAELARYTGPLTEEQADRALRFMGDNFAMLQLAHFSAFHWDAAIRRVRGKK